MKQSGERDFFVHFPESRLPLTSSGLELAAGEPEKGGHLAFVASIMRGGFASIRGQRADFEQANSYHLLRSF